MPNNVIGFKINGQTYPYDHDHLANIPVVDASPTAGSTNAVQSGGVYQAIESVRLVYTDDGEGNITVEEADNGE